MFTGESWPSRYSSGSAIKLDSLAKQLHTLCLKQIHADWTGCTFDRLCVLKLSDIRCIGADEFERIITTSPMLRILELRRVSILSRKSDSKPVVSQNLEILRLSYLDSLTLRDVFNILAPATYDIELDVDADCLRGSNPRRAKITDEISMLKYRINKYKTHTIRTLGITRAPALLKPLLSSLVSFLPDLTTLRIEGMVLSRDLLLVVESTLQSCPQIKTLQMRRIQTDVETFKNVIENSSVDRIELADCWSTWNDTKSRITPGTPSFEWGLKSAPKVLFLKE
ncbi:hypothetical protein FRC11_004559 [Ceratobasidium sp. 423]|nr:hypothetical protein FRC11_004559 [Ceratobasidium sp. 423]